MVGVANQYSYAPSLCGNAAARCYALSLRGHGPCDQVLGSTEGGGHTLTSDLNGAIEIAPSAGCHFPSTIRSIVTIRSSVTRPT